MVDEENTRARFVCEELPKLRSDAKCSGSNRYFTGKPCVNGHFSERITVNGHCVECERERDRSPQRRSRQNVLRNDRRANSRAERNAKEKAWRDANRDRIRLVQNEWFAKNSEAILKRRRDAYAENIEERRAKRRADRAADPDKFRAWDRGWYYANPEKAKERGRNLHASRKGAEGKHTSADIAHIRKAQKDRCACCRAKLNGSGHVDHIVALARGGSNCPSNLQLLCESCNCAKGAKDNSEFMQIRGMLL
ncbi:MAG: HNH endonuclease [Methylocystis sp.]